MLNQKKKQDRIFRKISNYLKCLISLTNDRHKISLRFSLQYFFFHITELVITHSEILIIGSERVK